MGDSQGYQIQLENIQQKYVGTGNSETTKWEWASQIQRDTLNSHVQSPSRLNYFALCENLPLKEIQMRMMERMVLPLEKRVEEREIIFEDK